MKLRINKLLSDAGLGSRREVEEYIVEGRVKINGRLAQLSDYVSISDVVLLDDVDLPVRDLIQDDFAERKYDERSKSKPKQSRTDHRAEAQRIKAEPKSASLRKTSKNNPENKLKAIEERNRKYRNDHDEDEEEFHGFRKGNRRPDNYKKFRG